MQSRRLAIPDVVLLEPRVFPDDRGLFFESFSETAFADAVGYTARFVQDNHSVSHRNVLRGLHYQLPPFAQGKLVRVVAGAVFDVAVDIRSGSPTYGQWIGETLTASNRRQLWIPEGFAHGFLALEEGTEVLYKTTAIYDKGSERSVLWSDAEIGIIWPITANPILSGKDAEAPIFAAADLPD